MGKWVGRFAVQIVFDAEDANEAREIADRMGENPPSTWCGHPIVGRTPFWFAELGEDEASNQDSDPAKERR